MGSIIVFCRKQRQSISHYSMRILKIVTLLIFFIGFTSVMPVWAKDGNIEITTFNAKKKVKHYEMNAVVMYQLSADLHRALSHGVRVNSYLNIYLGKHRSWWWNSSETIAQIVFQLRYHSLSKQYILTRADTNQSWNFRSLPRALKKMGEIKQYTLLKAPSNSASDNYYLYAQAKLSAQKLSFPLKVQSYFSNKYVMESEGVLWSLP
ncbi:MAG: Unknown protein [uncultured Thiotrichaceae bacterium]|uniref:DUF4390 domain-containing protein n=1 Tax=uncultured Thiotrichaceae bacterium TaxID=298394 RepID=A0A6S6U0F9_9GAMM|nr:MAG: Unknown protein [uncultured Thiotrichaceae bacterium]